MLGTAKQKAETPFDLEKCAILFWLSTECTTYSQNALGTHRAKKVDDERPGLGNAVTPTTAEARNADALNNKLVHELQKLVLTPDD